MTRPSSICALPGCRNSAYGQDSQRGYCNEHTGAALVDALDDVARYLDQLVGQVDRIARHLEDRVDS